MRGYRLPWQGTDAVLAHFASTAGAFVPRGSKRTSVRTCTAQVYASRSGGWEFIPTVSRGREGRTFDERIRGLSLTAVGRTRLLCKQNILRGITEGRALRKEENWPFSELLPG